MNMTNQRSKAGKKWLLGALTGLALVGAAGGFWYHQSSQSKPKTDATQPGNGKAPAVPEFIAAEIGRVSQQVVNRAVEANGSLVAARMAMVRTKVAAEVRSISLREGDVVSAGQTVAQLDANEGQERTRGADGVVASAEARAANAKTSRDTQRRLLDQNYISQAAFDGFESAYKAAQGDLASARAQAALARQGLSDAVTRAPMSGVVAKRFVNPGEKVGFDAPLIQIVDLGSLELNAWIDPDWAGSLRVGQPVRVRVSGFADELDATLARVMPTVDNSTRQLGIVVQLKAHKLALKSGLDATARLSFGAGSGPTVVVPMQALQSANGEPFVWMLGGTDAAPTVSRVRLSLGARDEAAGVVAGTPTVGNALPVGGRVLLGRYDGLKDGQAIKLVSAKAAPKAAEVASAAASNAMK